MISLQDVEMLARLLMRAGVNDYEAAWANAKMDVLRADAAAAELQQKQTKEVDDD